MNLESISREIYDNVKTKSHLKILSICTGNGNNEYIVLNHLNNFRKSDNMKPFVFDLICYDSIFEDTVIPNVQCISVRNKFRNIVNNLYLSNYIYEVCDLIRESCDVVLGFNFQEAYYAKKGTTLQQFRDEIDFLKEISSPSKLIFTLYSDHVLDLTVFRFYKSVVEEYDIFELHYNSIHCFLDRKR